MRVRSRKNRRGAATVELALTLPVLSGIIFGFIEACGLLYSTQSLEIAAYEACRMAIRSTAYQREQGAANVMTNAQVEAYAENVLEERGIVDAEVTIDTEDLTSLSGGDVVSVTITAPIAANSLVPQWFWQQADLTAVASMVKESTSE